MGANPEGYPERDPRYMYMFIHNVYANFFKDALDYFSGHLYPRFEFTVIGTYDKGVEYIIKKCAADGQETDRPMLPALILNPSGEFDLADAIATGKQMWRFPNLNPGFVDRLFEPVYKDEQVLITVGFIRMQGDIELLMLLNSFYEYCDVKMLFLQIFGGYERWIYPQYFNSFMIIPPELVNYTYKNPVTGQSYNLDWDRFGATEALVKTIGREELVLPVEIKPIYKLTGFGDASNRYGGADKIADWRLTATIHYEIEIPSFMILESNWLAEEIDVNIKTGSAYSEYAFRVPENRQIKNVFKESGIDDTTASLVCTESDYEDYSLRVRYYYLVTQADVDSTGDLVIGLSSSVDDINSILVNSKYGQMDYWDHYFLQNGNTEIVIRQGTVELEADMIIELYFYKRKT